MNTNELIKYIIDVAGYICLSWVVVTFEPLMNIRKKYISSSKNVILQLLNQVLGCVKCFSLWFTLIYTGCLFTACITCLMAHIIDKSVSKMPIKI
jgi:hypothetical protein